MVEHHKVKEEVILWAQQMVRQDKHFWNLMNRDWVNTQMQDPVISQVIRWIWRPKTNKSTLDEFMRAKGVPEVDWWLYAQRQSDFILRDNLLFLNVTPANSTETMSVFVVPESKHQAAIDRCHQCAWHQGRDRTLSLMKEQFWWPGMARALVLAVSNYGYCKQFKARPQIPGMQPIICTEPMELVHIGCIGIEVTVATQEKPVIKNVLVVVDHFTWYVQAFVTWNQMARTTALVLYNEYFSVFGFPQ